MDIIMNIENSKKVYNALGDDMSKRFWENLLMYNMTNDKKYIDELARNANVTKASEKIRQVYKKEMSRYETSTLLKVVDILNQELKYSHVVICGAMGKYAQKLLKHIKKVDNLVLCDQRARYDECHINGIRVITYEEALTMNKALYVISSDSYYLKIKEELLSLGVDKQDIVFVDVRSYKCLLQGLGHEYVADPTCRNLLEETYFDKEIMLPETNEVFIDCGFYDGFSTKQFIKWCNYNYEKIIAFEPDPKNYKAALEIKDINFLELHNSGCWCEKGILNFIGGQGEASYIDYKGKDVIYVETIDDVLQGERCTFIKMDIEGAELKALQGAKNTITKFHPRLAISIYHKSEDVIEIPAYILSLCQDYTFYIRHYTFRRCDTVLYAVLHP